MGFRGQLAGPARRGTGQRQDEGEDGEGGAGSGGGSPFECGTAKVSQRSKQVDLALGYVPDHADALLLKGQLLIVDKKFAEAQANLNKYLRQRSSDMAAKSLVELCQKPHPDDEATSLAFARVFNQQEAYGLIDGVLAPWGKTSAAARDFLLQKYRKQIEAAWAGRGDRLEMDTAGLRLNFEGFADVRDLSPLRNMPLTSLNLKNCQQVQDLSPLRGMLLTSLNVHFCK